MFTNKAPRFIISDIVFISMILLAMYFFYYDMATAFTNEYGGIEGISMPILYILLAYVAAGGINTFISGKLVFILFPPIIEYFTRSMKSIIIGVMVILLANILVGTTCLLVFTEYSLLENIFFSAFFGAIMIFGIGWFNSVSGRTGGATNSDSYRKKYLDIGVDSVTTTGDIKQDKINAVNRYMDSKKK